MCLVVGGTKGPPAKGGRKGGVGEAAGPDQAGPGRCKEALDFILKTLSRGSMMPLIL